MKVKVNGLGHSFIVDINKTAEVKSLKERIEEKTGVPPAEQRVFGGGKELVEGHCLFQYQLPDECAVTLLRRPPKKEEEEKDEEPPNKKLKLEDERENQENRCPAVSEYYAVGDLVDAVDSDHKAWFAGKITEINEWNLDYYDNGSNATSDGLEYWVEFVEGECPGRCRLGEIRPRALQKIPSSELKEGDTVSVNYNFEEPTKLGFWYDAIITEPPQARRKTLKAIVQMPDGTGDTECVVKLEPGVFAIRQSVLRAERDAKELENNPEFYPVRKHAPRCPHCGDISDAHCKKCSCTVCGGKQEPDKIILCDECGDMYHLFCLNPPLDVVPDDDWFCPECRRDTSEVVGAGQKLKKSKIMDKRPSAKMAAGKRDWGHGNATAGRDKIIDWVPNTHFGAIRGVEVGMTWEFRLQLSGRGIHRPVVGGISGRSSGDTKGCFSICVSGGYEDDEDNGDTITFTGSGGRNLKDGNKRTSEQDSDQELKGGNLSLAYSCIGGKGTPRKEGETAKDWKKNLPIRVCRSSKAKKHHPEFAPEAGCRYDGIYKMVKYWRQKGKSGFYVYKFQLRRDDPTPAPWTKEGKKRIKDLGIDKMVKKGENENDVWKKYYKLSAEEKKLIEEDAVNKRFWDDCCEMLPAVEMAFLEKVSQTFCCGICQINPPDPVNAEACGHLFCVKCITRWLKEKNKECPSCRTPWGDNAKPVVNKNLKKALNVFLPGYHVGQK